MCSHSYNWKNQRTINNKHYGVCTHCGEVVRIEHQGWKYCGDTSGYVGVKASVEEVEAYNG